MASITKSRRRSTRYELPEELQGSVEFGYPTPKGHRCSMPLRDINASGLSFVLAHELPGIEVGRSLERVTVHIGRHAIRGDLVVMHLSPDETPGSICGTLFYPSTDSDIVKLKNLIDDLVASGAAQTA